MKTQINEIKRMQLLAGVINESQLEEISTGGLDPKVLIDFIEKYGSNFSGTDTSVLQSIKDKELFLDDLLTTQDGLVLLSGKFPNLADVLKKYNIKINLNKANIEHPNYVAKIYDALIKPGIIKLDDLKKVPNIVDKADAASANWSDEVISKLKDQNHITAAQILKGTAVSQQAQPQAESLDQLDEIVDKVLAKLRSKK